MPYNPRSPRLACLRRLALALALAISVASPGHALACTDRTEARVPVRQLLPEADLSIAHWPAQQQVLIGSVLSVLVPAGTTVDIQAVSKGMTEPVGTVTDTALSQAAARLDYPEGWSPVKVDPARQQWVHLHATSFGKSRVVFQGPQGWSYRLTLGVVYASEQPRGEPVPLDGGSSDSAPTFTLTASRPSLWISLPGTVEQGWRLGGGAELGLSLARIEQLEVPYGDPPRVGLFIRGGRSPRPGTLVLLRSGPGPGSFPIKLETRPTPLC